MSSGRCFETNGQNETLVRTFHQKKMFGATFLEERELMLLLSEATIEGESVKVVEFYRTSEPHPYTLICLVPVPGLQTDNCTGMEVCNKRGCIYISDKQSCRVYKVLVDVMSGSVDEWRVPDGPRSLSIIPGSGNILVTCDEHHKLQEFLATGRLVNEIKLDCEIGKAHHAVQLESEPKRYVVAHSGAEGVGLSVIDSTGSLLTSYRTSTDPSSSLKGPRHLIADVNQTLFVVDVIAQKLFHINTNPNLSVRRCVTSFEQGVVWRVCLNAGRGKLFVVSSRPTSETVGDEVGITVYVI